MDIKVISGIGSICLAVLTLVLLPDFGCSQSSEKPGETTAVGIEASAEVLAGNQIRLTLKKGGAVWKSKTVSLSGSGPVTHAEFRDGWVVATLHMNPSSSILVAWNPETDKTCYSPGCTWLATEDHFITIHKVHFNPPEDEKLNRFWCLDGDEIPLVTELPDKVDGVRGSFCMLLSESPEGSVYRLSCYEDDMYDSTILLLGKPAGDWEVIGINRNDSGGHVVTGYYNDTETEYSVTWNSGWPVMAIKYIYREGDVMLKHVDKETHWYYDEKSRPGILEGEKIIWTGHENRRASFSDSFPREK